MELFRKVYGFVAVGLGMGWLAVGFVIVPVARYCHADDATTRLLSYLSVAAFVGFVGLAVLVIVLRAARILPAQPVRNFGEFVHPLGLGAIAGLVIAALLAFFAAMLLFPGLAANKPLVDLLTSVLPMILLLACWAALMLVRWRRSAREQKGNF